MAYIYDLTDTWSAGGTAFNAIKMNVTDSASAAGSKLITLQTNGAEHFSVSKAGVGYFSGNVGIGTGSPNAKLDVRGNMWVRQADASYLNFNSTSVVADIEFSNTNNLRFVHNAVTEVMRLTSSGNVGIGNSAPGYRLVVNAAGTGTNLVGTFTTTVTGSYLGFFDATTSDRPLVGAVGNNFAVRTAVGEAMRIDASGNVGIGTSSPTVRLQVESSAAYQAHFKGTDAAGAGGIRTLNSGGSAGVALLTYGPSYVGGTIGSIGANGSAVVQTGDAPIFVGTDSGISQPLYLGTNGSERMRVDASGNVAIGTTAPNSKFVVTYSNPTTVPAAGAGGHCAAFGTVGYGLAAGAITNGNAYLQATRWDTLATNYDLLLQPNGGNVGIGTSSPSTSLDVATAGNRSGGNIYIGSKANNFTKYTALVSTQYAYDAEPEGFAMIATQSSSTSENSVRIGGYIGELNAATDVIFYTAANTTTRAGTERMRLDSSGNLLVGTTSADGIASNTARVTGGVFSTLRSSASVANGTATTIATLPSGDGNYIVSAALTNSASPASFNELAIVSISQSTAVINVLVNASALSLSMSGLNLQVTQGQGTTQTVQFSVLRIL